MGMAGAGSEKERYVPVYVDLRIHARGLVRADREGQRVLPVSSLTHQQRSWLKCQVDHASRNRLRSGLRADAKLSHLKGDRRRAGVGVTETLTDASVQGNGSRLARPH